MQTTWAAKIGGDREDPRVRLQTIFGGAVPISGQPPEPALVWAKEVLRQCDGMTLDDLITVVSILRKAEPRLTLRGATFLATHAVRPL